MLRLLAGHPEFEVVWVTGQSAAGDSLGDHWPHLATSSDPVIAPTDASAIAERADWAVLGLPHGASARLADELLERGVGVVDLSASFRLDRARYEAHYEAHPCPQRLDDAVYGLAEIHRERLRGARLIAGPGCFPTGVTLAVAAAYRAGMASEGPLIADCKTGVTGAGAAASSGTHFCNVADRVMPYKVEGHRHGPEIARNLSDLANRTVRVRFTPHLIPVRRGILSTCYVPLEPGVDAAALREASRAWTENEPFLHLLEAGRQPDIARVAGTNRVELQVVCDLANGLAVMTSAIDNLCRGSSGGALQALNVALGLDEGAGLSHLTPSLP
jgi:N-acetyl-gamma-glutamyl-phosphate reductase